jgi:hypothetical protein
MQVLRLVPLTDDTSAHQVLHELLHVRKMKIASQPMQRALYSFVAFFVHGSYDLLDQGRGRRNVEASRELDHVVHYRSGRLPCAGVDRPGSDRRAELGGDGR